MQVFLCDFTLEQSAKILDSKRLNKQIVEAFQIVTDRLPNFHHPAYLFWKEYKRELRQYMYCLCNEYSNRFHKEHKCSIMAIPDEIKTFYFIPNIEYNLYAHKVNLLRKNYEWYSQFLIYKILKNVQKVITGMFLTEKILKSKLTVGYNILN